MGVDGIDGTFKLTTLDDLDDISNFKQSIWIWLTPQGFQEFLFWMWVQAYYCDLGGPFLQSAFPHAFTFSI